MFESQLGVATGQAQFAADYIVRVYMNKQTQSNQTQSDTVLYIHRGCHFY
jgi:hypothetical protein